MIEGADATSDLTILGTGAKLYGNFKKRHVFLSAISPIGVSVTFNPGARKSDAPPLDAGEAQWLTF